MSGMVPFAIMPRRLIPKLALLAFFPSALLYATRRRTQCIDWKRHVAGVQHSQAIIIYGYSAIANFSLSKQPTPDQQTTFHYRRNCLPTAIWSLWICFLCCPANAYLLKRQRQFLPTLLNIVRLVSRRRCRIVASIPLTQNSPRFATISRDAA